MLKYSVIECYLCPKERRLIYVIRDTITETTLQVTEKEWREIESQEYSVEEVDAWKEKLESQARALKFTSDTKHQRRRKK